MSSTESREKRIIKRTSPHKSRMGGLSVTTIPTTMHMEASILIINQWWPAMLVKSQDITPENVAPLRRSIAAWLQNIRYMIAHISYLLPIWVVRDNSLSSTTKIGVGRWPTQIDKPEHPSKSMLEPQTNCCKTLRAEFTWCTRKKQTMLWTSQLVHSLFFVVEFSCRRKLLKFQGWNPLRG